MMPTGLRFALSGLLAAALLHAASPTTEAQSPATGALRVMVVDEANVPVSEVLVTLTGAAGGVWRARLSDLEGDVRFTFLPPGTYDVLLERLGFVPRRITGVPVRPGRQLHLELRVDPTGSATPGLVEEAYAGGEVASGQVIPGELLRTAPLRRRALAELDRFTTVGEGLPSWFSATAVDGVRLAPAGGSLFAATRTAGSALPVHGLAGALVDRQLLDVEWSGGAGALLAAHSSAATTGAEAAVEWSGSALPGPSFGDGVESFNELNARAAVSTRLFGDSAAFTFGLEARGIRETTAPAWPDGDAAAALVELANERQLPLGGLLEPAVAVDEAYSGFAALRTPLGAGHRLQVAAHAALLPRVTAYDARTGLASELEGHDAVAAASLFSEFGANTANELRAGFTTSARDADSVAWTARVQLVEDGLSIGPLHPASTSSTLAAELTDALHFRAGAHALELGLGARLVSHDIGHRAGGAGEYFFSSVAAMRADSGVYVRHSGPARSASWSDLSYALFAQDTWAVLSGVEVQAGVRAERLALPVDDVRRDDEWLRLSGVANDLASSGRWVVSPRVGLTWDPRGDRSWLLHAAGGVYHEDVDPLLLSQWLLDDGSGRTRRIVGSTAWPALPGAGPDARRLTLLAESFRPAQTARVTAGIGHALAPGTAVEFAGSFGRTTHLPRRTDLNALPLPVARDQHERPVFGVLVQQRGILAAEPGSGRRFPEYDEVAAIASDGESEHWSLTAALERTFGAGLGVLARYTFSRTTDDWFGAADGGWTVPVPAGLPEGWAEARSDFDVPHRAVLALLYDAPFGLELAAALNYRSGLPFTPGFRPGVDANGDGYAGNDPAFVDPDVTGMPALIREWSCLRTGEFAGRNACRTGSVQTLDLRAAFTALRFGRGSAALTLEAFDLLESAPEIPDAALYRVDPTGTLVRDPDARTVTVPLVANPDFGTPLTRRDTGRKLRLGVSLNW